MQIAANNLLLMEAWIRNANKAITLNLQSVILMVSLNLLENLYNKGLKIKSSIAFSLLLVMMRESRGHKKMCFNLGGLSLCTFLMSSILHDPRPCVSSDDFFLKMFSRKDDRGM